MPLYDYRCKKCKYLFEVEQKITEEPLKFCPKCKEEVQRLVGPVGIVFKGSGFHVTDYGRKEGREEKKEEKPKVEEKPKKEEKKETKPK